MRQSPVPREEGSRRGWGAEGGASPSVCATGLTSSEPGLGPDEGTGADEETKAQSGGRSQGSGPWGSYTSVGFTGHAGRKKDANQVECALFSFWAHTDTLSCSSSVQHWTGLRNSRTADWLRRARQQLGIWVLQQ